ncbi:MAG: nitroreductase [Deltaproteobacteria bacterium]|nr:nitroreductase [Deltaproteobacteria bacterium]
MNVWEAIEARRSYRVFKENPVSKTLIKKILTAGGQAPSSANMQPWEFVVVSGQERDDLSQMMLKSFKDQKKGYDILGKDSFFPQQLLDRRKKFFTDVFKKLFKHKVSPMKFVMEGTLRFYGAPIIILAFIDKRIAKRFLFDIGACVQNILLTAQSEGLGTHLIGLILKYQDAVKKKLHIPKEKEMVVGICLGYPDMENPVNDFTPGREDLDQFVKWVGI